MVMDLNSRLASSIHSIKNKLRLVSLSVDCLRESSEQKTRDAADHVRRGVMDVNQELAALLGLVLTSFSLFFKQYATFFLRILASQWFVKFPDPVHVFNDIPA